jgi:hypothetical protein
MRLQSLYGLTFLLIAAPAWADPCVSSTFDRPFPDATDVEAFITDVPSAQFPAFWQRGFIDGYRYNMFSNGDGEIKASDPNENWTVEIACETRDQSCEMASDGDAPTEVLQIADTIGQCLLGIEIIKPVVAPSVPEEQIVEAPLTDIVPPSRANEVQQNDTTTLCGVAAVNEPTDVATMQRLLILLDEDPGPVDGFLGPASFKAMDIFIDDSNWDTSIADVIVVLDALHCERVQ